jgi:hypothetical protein
MKMKRIQELREKRAAVWEQAKKFLDEHRQENGLISPEDTAVYEKMEDEVVSLGKEIAAAIYISNNSSSLSWSKIRLALTFSSSVISATSFPYSPAGATISTMNSVFS